MADRQKRYIAKLKEEGKYSDYRKRQNDHSKKSKLKQKAKILALPSSLRKQKLKDLKTANNRRVTKCRNLKKQKFAEAAASKVHSPFSSAIAFNKAKTRAKRMMDQALPSSPRKRRRVSRQLYAEECAGGSPVCSKQRAAPNALDDDTIKLVTQFYECDDISRQAPGMKDCCSVRDENGGKKKVQLRHLTQSLMETYALFSSEFPEAKIGKSKFADLRPKHVCLSNKLPHIMCLCKHHENFIFAVDALHKACPAFPSYTHDFPESLLCDSASRKCWLNECPECKDAAGFKKKYQHIFNDTSSMSDATHTWYIWENDGESRIKKIVEEGTIEELQQHVSDLIPQFLNHCFVKRAQSAAYNEDRQASLSESYDPEIAVLQVDFSENYTCVWQDEVQSAHWHQKQLTVFTAATWHTGAVHSSVIVSDNLVHSKETLVAYMDKLLEDIPPEVKVVKIWSDGPRSQFKNKFVAASISPLQKKHDVDIKWNYFATSHGKGPVDGIGGATKRFVMNGVRCRKHIVTDSASFVAAADGMINVKVELMTSEDIEIRNASLHLKEVFEKAEPVKGIAQVHSISIKDGKVVSSLLTTDSSESSDSETSADDDRARGEEPQTPNRALNGENGDKEVKVGEWLVVEYGGVYYPGEVKEIGDDDYRVSVMHPAGVNWKWPVPRDDKTFYLKKQIIKKLKEPIIANNRGHFKFTSQF